MNKIEGPPLQKGYVYDREIWDKLADIAPGKLTLDESTAPQFVGGCTVNGN